MSLLPDFKTIPIKNVHQKSNWDLHPFTASETATDQLASIASMGILNPPMVLEEPHEGKEKEYLLLSDPQRFREYKSTFPEKTTMPVLVLPQTLSKEDVLQYLFTYKLQMNHFSPMEKAYFFNLCLSYMAIHRVANFFLPQLNEKPQPHIITKYISLTKLDPAIQNSIHSGQLSPKIGIELSFLPVEDRLELHALFQLLEFGGGKQKRLLALCKDLAGKHDRSIKTILGEKQYSDILNHKEMNKPQKGAALLSCLHEQLFPESNRAEEDFNRRVKRMELPPCCTTEHSQFFEKDEVMLTITFPTLNAMEEKVTAIKQLF